MRDELRAICTLFEGLPRGGPGDDACTRAALRRLPPLPPRPRVVDVGCGPGAPTRVLARELGTIVEAVDAHRPFLVALQRAARAEGLSERILPRQADMKALPYAPASLDLIWCEGAIFVLGFAEGLRRWRPLLCPAGLVVASEACWFTADPPAEARDFWAEGYPEIAGEAETRRRAELAGYERLGDFRLPRAAWDEFYRTLAPRVAALAPRAEADPTVAGVAEETRREMEIHRRFGDCYGYTFFLLRRAS
ncbi:MAG: class I SAM-dependent methyltransferase [Planctomycetota bacterium]